LFKGKVLEMKRTFLFGFHLVVAMAAKALICLNSHLFSIILSENNFVKFRCH
jgi:hypothetical protein